MFFYDSKRQSERFGKDAASSGSGHAGTAGGGNTNACKRSRPPSCGEKIGVRAQWDSFYKNCFYLSTRNFNGLVGFLKYFSVIQSRN